MMKSCCSSKACAIVGKIVLLLLTITEIASAYGVYMAIFGRVEASFYGSTSSMAMMAFALNTAVWTYYGKMHCSGGCGDSK